jgi:hypothetical protein
MDGRGAGVLGMIVGGLGILVAGLIDPYTTTLLWCGSLILSSGILAVAIAGKAAGNNQERSTRERNA